MPMPTRRAPRSPTLRWRPSTSNPRPSTVSGTTPSPQGDQTDDAVIQAQALRLTLIQMSRCNVSRQAQQSGADPKHPQDLRQRGFALDVGQEVVTDCRLGVNPR